MFNDRYMFINGCFYPIEVKIKNWVNFQPSFFKKISWYQSNWYSWWYSPKRLYMLKKSVYYFFRSSQNLNPRYIIIQLLSLVLVFFCVLFFCYIALLLFIIILVLHFFLVTGCHLYYLSLPLSFHFSFVFCHHHAFHLFWLSSLPLLVIITIDVYFCCCSLSPLVLVIALLFVFAIMVYHHPYYSSLGNRKLRWLFLDTLGVHFDQILTLKHLFTNITMLPAHLRNQFFLKKN